MGTTADKLNAVLDSKEAIRQAIEYRGVDIPMDTTLAEYADKIGEIPTGGTLTDEQALVFIGECANGKRKIAKALTQKYEPTNEYETFDEMAEKIKTLPLEIREDIPQPYSIVWNEMQKAFAQYGGEGVYCCAVELTKWDYDKDNTISLSGADAYYTSEGKYVTQNGEYQFDDLYADNAMRYVIYFFDHKDYTIPLDLPAVAVTNIYCLNGCPKFPIGNLYTNLFGIYSYTRDKYIVADNNDLNLNNLTSLKTLILCSIEEMRGGQIQACTYANPNMPDLKRIDGGMFLFQNFQYWYAFGFPNLEYVNTRYFPYGDGLRTVIYPKLKKAEGQYWVSSSSNSQPQLYLIDCPELEEFNLQQPMRINYKEDCLINMPKLRDTGNYYLFSNLTSSNAHIKLGNPVGGNIKLYSGSASTVPILVTIEKDFASDLKLTNLNGITKEALVDILNNLADLTDTEYADKLTLTLGSTLYDRITADDRLIATNKKWQVIK
jgi:hypothetical protein